MYSSVGTGINDNVRVTIENRVIKKSDYFRFLGSITERKVEF